MPTLVSEAGVTSPGAGLGGRYGNPGVPSHQDPPLGVIGRVGRKGRADTVGASAAAGVAGGIFSGCSVRVYSHSLRFSQKQPQGSGGSAAGSTGLQGTSSRQKMYLT